MIITLTVAGICGIVFFILTMRVSQVRLASKVSLGDGGNAALLVRIRAHANFAEFVPLCLILMGLVETYAERSLWLGALGILLILARIAHPIGMAMPAPNALRVVGAAGTATVLVVLSLWALVISLNLHGVGLGR